MYSDSGDDVMNDKPLHVDTAEEQADQDMESNGASKSKRRKTNTDPVDDNDVTVSVEGETMSNGETEHPDQVDENMDSEDVALIKEEKPVDSGTKEHMKQPAHQERAKREQIAERSKIFNCAVSPWSGLVWFGKFIAYVFIKCNTAHNTEMLAPVLGVTLHCVITSP